MRRVRGFLFRSMVGEIGCSIFQILQKGILEVPSSDCLVFIHHRIDNYFVYNHVARRGENMLFVLLACETQHSYAYNTLPFRYVVLRKHATCLYFWDR